MIAGEDTGGFVHWCRICGALIDSNNKILTPDGEAYLAEKDCPHTWHNLTWQARAEAAESKLSGIEGLVTALQKLMQAVPRTYYSWGVDSETKVRTACNEAERALLEWQKIKGGLKMQKLATIKSPDGHLGATEK
jgi:hypothetical protein